MTLLDRVLIHLSDYRRLPIDPATVYYLEAAGDETIVRRRSARTVRDVRSLGELLPAFEPYGFRRVHRGFAVNLRRVREIKRRKEGDAWQLRMQPPVNRLLPIGPTHLAALWEAFGDR